MVRNLNQIDKLLGLRLRDIRTSTGWSHEQLADKLQIDAKDIIAYEKGVTRISAECLLRFSKVFGVGPEYFLRLHREDFPTRREETSPALTEQGLRLHRAFFGVKSTALREAIVSFVTELARSDDLA